MRELWRPIRPDVMFQSWWDMKYRDRLGEFAYRYTVSNLGRVRRNGKPYRFKIIPGRYSCVSLRYKPVGAQQVGVHRLVAGAFLDRPSRKHVVNHVNARRHDNRVTNLEWATRVEDAMHRGLASRLKRLKRMGVRLKSLQKEWALFRAGERLLAKKGRAK